MKEPLFTYRRNVRFAETDAAGVAHFSQLFCWAEEAEHAFWKSHGYAVHPSSQSKFPAPVGWPRIAAEGKFLHPLRLDQELHLNLEAEIIDHSTLRWHMEGKAQEQLAAKITLTVVAVAETEHGRWQKTAIPEQMKNLLV